MIVPPKSIWFVAVETLPPTFKLVIVPANPDRFVSFKVPLELLSNVTVSPDAIVPSS